MGISVHAPDLDALPAAAACSTAQVSKVSGFAVGTLKKWRRTGGGPKVTIIEGRPRYLGIVEIQDSQLD